jgi:photosystem II stability/assembly factor-like uncharacterized protein
VRAQNLTGDVWSKPIAPLGVQGILDITQKSTEYWAAGPDGIIKSTNLTTWTKVATTGLTDSIFCLRWTGTQFVATGFGAWTSPDGIAWTRRATFSLLLRYGMATRGNTVVAAGDLGTVQTSTDGGITWTRTDLGVDYVFTAVAATASKFVIVGGGGVIFNSPDGLVWTQRDSTTTRTLRDVTLAGTKLVAVGDDLTVVTSTDHGNTWASYQAAVGTGLPFTAVAGDATYTMMFTQENVARSTNPSLPSTIGFLSVPHIQADINCGIRGTTGWIFGGNGGTIVTSTDTNTWTLRHPVLSVKYLAATRTSSHFLAAGFPGDKFMRSADGLTWAAVTTGFPATEAVTSLTWSGSRLVLGTATGKIYTSTAADGSLLTLRASGTTQRLNSSAWTGSQFLMCGMGGTILSSVDGTTWAARTSGTTANLYGAATSGSVHVICGVLFGPSYATGVILTSTNGISWTETGTFDYSAFYGVAWNGSLFTVVGSDGKILTSPDGQAWTAREVDPLSDGRPFENALSAVTWAGGNWIATTERGGVVLSTDGIDWKSQTIAGGDVINAITYGASRAVIVGESGQVLTSISTAPKPPVFLVPPMGQTLPEGDYAALGAAMAGTPILTYQWYKDGAEISGATAFILPIPNAGAQDSGSYHVTVTGPGGTVTSPPETVRVRARPAITVHPVSQLVEVGGGVTLTVTAVGAGPLTYQWYKTGTGALAGRTSASLTLTGVTLAAAGEYYVEITNEYGTSTSTVGALTITLPLAPVLDLPAGVTVQTGGNASWVGGVEFHHDGMDAAHSGTISHSGVSWLEIQVSNMSAITFWWNVSSEAGYDLLRFHANGTLVDNISGIGGGWRQVTHALDPSTTTTLRWEYSKDGIIAAGQDRAWLDEVVLTPHNPVTDFPIWAASLPAGRRNPSDRNGPLYLENILSYALGINPLTATPSQMPALQQAGARWHFTYSRTRRTIGTGYRVEWSTDLAATTWSTAGVVHEQTGTATEGTAWRAIITPPVDAGHLFVRLRVALDGTGG